MLAGWGCVVALESTRAWGGRPWQLAHCLHKVGQVHMWQAQAAFFSVGNDGEHSVYLELIQLITRIWPTLSLQL